MLVLKQRWRCADAARRQSSRASGCGPHSTRQHARLDRHSSQAAAATRSRPSSAAAAASGAEQQLQQEQALDTTSIAQRIVQRLRTVDGLQAASLVAAFTSRRAPLPTSTHSPPPLACTRSQLDLNLDHLLSSFTPPQVAKLMHMIHPELLSHDLIAWQLFFHGLGLTSTDFYTLLIYSPKAVLHNTPYTAGSAILFLKSFGIPQEEVVSRIIPCYPELLSVPDHQLRDAAAHFTNLGVVEHPTATLRLIQQCPAYFIPSLHTQLFPILDRIQNSRSGKFSKTGSYWI